MKRTFLRVPVIMAAAFAAAGSGVALADDQGQGKGSDRSTMQPSGGNSSDNISTQGRTNTNGPNAADREFGRDRATERANSNSNLNDRTDDDDDDHIGDKNYREKPAKPLTTKSTPDGGQSSEHISDQGRANTNGPNAADREFGGDRADERETMRNSRQKPD